MDTSAQRQYCYKYVFLFCSYHPQTICICMNSMNTDILNVVEGALFFTRSFCGLEIRLFGLKQFMIYFDHTEESWEW